MTGEGKGTKERHRRRQPAKQVGEGKKAEFHGLEIPGQIWCKQQNARATWIGSSGGPQGKEDKQRKEPKQEQPRAKEQAGNRAQRSGAEGGGQPTRQKHPGGRNLGQEHPGQTGVQPQDWVVQGNGPSATDWNIRGREKATQQQGPLD